MNDYTPRDENGWLRDRLFDQRLVFLRGELSDELAGRVAAELMFLDASGDDPIDLYIDSPGGSLEAAFTVMDTIDLVGIDVIATCVGRVEGSAVGAVAVAHRRRATPNARFRLSQPTATMTGRASELDAWARDRAHQMAQFVRRIAEATRQPVEHVEAALDTGQYLDAEGALRYGLIDEVVPIASRRRSDGVKRMPPGFRPPPRDV
jgi:ATP-dependent Clp protease protease subunit